MARRAPIVLTKRETRKSFGTDRPCARFDLTMLDSILRPAKDRLLAPVARGPVAALSPTTISGIGLALTLGAAVAAAQRAPLLAVALWLAGRVADGLDGLVARASERDSDIGGVVDIIADVTGYAAIPIGVAFGVDDRAGWIAATVLLATFYVNITSWAYLSAVLEKRDLGAAATGQTTSVVMPRGLVEGTETIVFFTVALAFVDAATTVWWIMAAAVAVTALERLRWAVGVLK
jgi:phosphatidylglycerophosphate synthase